MRKTKLLVTLLCLWLGLMPLAAQSVTVVKELEQVPMASVLAMYKNEFGSFVWRDGSFPYSVIRMHLEGNGQAVKAAKEHLTLYLGQQFVVESRVTSYSNQILFLVRSRRPYIEIDCGDGCDKVLLSNMQQLQANCLYDCTVRFIPEEEKVAIESVDMEKLKSELLVELAATLKEQKEVIMTNEQQNQILQNDLNVQNISHVNEHEYVDLGLSVKWATCNVGAENPEDYGDYFAWGETTTKITYDWSTYKYCNGSSSTITKYNRSSNRGIVDNKTQLELNDDAARANWGGAWRMPTDAELTELKANCTWKWTTQNGVKGYKVTSKSNGNSIFLPVAGYRYGSSISYAGRYGFYWSSSLETSGKIHAWYANLIPSGVRKSFGTRNYGLSVRPVCQ